MNSLMDRFTRKPGMASSLSSVPPVCPRPRPLIIGTASPPAATSGARISDVLSPTPPVECLSTAFTPRAVRSSISPERSIASVRCAVSARDSPRTCAAISQAAAWWSGISPRVCPCTTCSISSRDSSTPLRFLRRISRICGALADCSCVVLPMWPVFPGNSLAVPHKLQLLVWDCRKFMQSSHYTGLVSQACPDRTCTLPSDCGIQSISGAARAFATQPEL